MLSQRWNEEGLGIGHAIPWSFLRRGSDPQLSGAVEQNVQHLLRCGAQEAVKPVLLADEMVVIGDVLSKNSVFEDQNAVDEQWFPIVAAYCADAGITIEQMRPADSSPAGPAAERTVPRNQET